MSGMIDRTTSILTQALDGLTAQQSVISSNLANIDTPGYTPKAVDFETALQREVDAWSSDPGTVFASSASPSADVAMKTTDPRHYSAVGTVGNGSSADVSAVNENTRNDGNKVDLETEMTALTQTQIKYSANSRLIEGKFAQLTTVLGGR
jgi:flagellar basal-body rod protein FlgB